MKYKVALVDDHVIYRMGIKSALARYEDVVIVLEANNGSELLEYILTEKVDIILLDLKMPHMSGYQTLKAIRVNDENLKVLILSMHEDEVYISLMMESKANGYLIKHSKPEEIYTAIVSCMNIGYYFNSPINQRLLENTLRLNKSTNDFKRVNNVFTLQELTILNLCCKGKTTQEIADEFSLNIRSIEYIKKKMQHRLGYKNTLQLILYAIKNNHIKL